MGTDCAPLLANLFLFFIIYKYVKNKLKESHRDAVLFRHTMRYIDDLLTINNPHLECNIPCKPAYEVYMSQLVRIGRISIKYEDFKDRHHMLTTRLLKQGYKYDVYTPHSKNSSINMQIFLINST